jgi:hypothetical protein
MFAGTFEITGATSVTVTVNDPDAVPPSASVAVQLTVVVAIANVDPDAGVHVNDASVVPDGGVAVALYVTTAPALLVAATVMFAGRLRVGGLMLDVTVTVNDFVVVLAAASVAEQSTVVVAIGNVDPDAGVHVTVRALPCESFALGVV